MVPPAMVQDLRHGCELDLVILGGPFGRSLDMGLSENVGLIFPMIASHFS